MLEPQPLPIEPVALHVEHPIVARTRVFLRRAGGQFDQLFFGKTPAQLGIGSSLTFDGVSDIASAMRSKAASRAVNSSRLPL